MSCGRVFAPGSDCLPVEALPNGGGCRVASSFEAKNFVIDWGQPSCGSLCSLRTESFSSNFDLNEGGVGCGESVWFDKPEDIEWRLN